MCFWYFVYYNKTKLLHNRTISKFSRMYAVVLCCSTMNIVLRSNVCSTEYNKTRCSFIAMRSKTPFTSLGLSHVEIYDDQRAPQYNQQIYGKQSRTCLIRGEERNRRGE